MNAGGSKSSNTSPRDKTVSTKSISQKPGKSTKKQKNIPTTPSDLMALPDEDIDNVGDEGDNKATSTKKETKKDDGRTEETLREFIKRKSNGLFKTIEIGRGAYSYRPISADEISSGASQTQKGLQKLGIKVIHGVGQCLRWHLRLALRC